MLLVYKPVQDVTVLNTVSNCNTVVSTVILYYNVIIKYYNLMGPPLYMRSGDNRNVITWRMTVFHDRRHDALLEYVR